MKRFAALSLSIIISLAALAIPQSAWAAASLYFSGNGTVAAGQNWSVTVLVSTTQPVNAVDTFITFPKHLLELTSVDGSGSNFPTDGPGSPAIDNGAGKVQIIRYSLGGYNGGAGKIATLVFKAKSTGSASLGFGVSKVIAHDGQGTNVYSGGGSATITVNAPAAAATPAPAANNPAPKNSSQNTPPPTSSQPSTNQVAAPAISSSSHPDQNAWYQAAAVQLAWTDASGKASGYNVEINNDPSTQLAEKITQTQTKLDAQLAKDGIWYTHVRSQTSSGWSPTSHYKIQLDATAPSQPTISISPDKDIKVRPDFTFSATDSGSTIASYQIKLDDGQWQTVTSPYKPTTISTGEHTVTLKAIDKAGNSSQASLKFTIAPLDAPTIASPDGSALSAGQFFKVSGKSVPGAKVEIYIDGQLSETVQADDQGAYQGQTVHFQLKRYAITTKAINADGIASQLSAEKVVHIGGVAVMGITLPNWMTYGAIGLLLLALLGVIGFLIFKLKRLRQTSSKADVEAVNTKLQDLEQLLDTTIDSSVAASNPQAAAQIKEQLADQIDKIEQTLITESVKTEAESVVATSKLAAIKSKVTNIPTTAKALIKKIKKPSTKQSQVANDINHTNQPTPSLATSDEPQATAPQPAPNTSPAIADSTSHQSPVASPPEAAPAEAPTTNLATSDEPQAVGAQAAPNTSSATSDPPSHQSPVASPPEAAPAEAPSPVAPPPPVAVTMPADAFDAVIAAEKTAQ